MKPAPPPAGSRAPLQGLLLAVMAGLSGFYSVRDGPDWGGKPQDTRAFDEFVSDVAAQVPPHARVLLVVAEGDGVEITSGRLNAALHPRVLVSSGPADWRIEISRGEFDRSKASLRKLSP